MSNIFFLFLITLLGLAIFLREDFVLAILYLFIGAYVFGRLWGQRTLQGISIQRTFNRWAFLGEKVTIQLQIKNENWLPLAWLQIRETLPVEIHPGGPYQQVATIYPKGTYHCEYSLSCRRRGYYPIGPLTLHSGDVLGMAESERFERQVDYLTIYPKIVPLSKVHLPSHTPIGTMRYMQPLMEDPSRVFGKRNYVTGDSFRRIDWKSTASTGSLQVKLFESSISLETVIFLDLDTKSYPLRARYDIAELAIVVAASLANWIIAERQAAGLATNGIDPISDERPPLLIPRRGRARLLRILETLARVQVAPTNPFIDLLQQERHNLPWGTTLIMITSRFDNKLFEGLFQARRNGLKAFLIQCGESDQYNRARRKAEHFGFVMHQVLNERDLDIWRT